LIESEGCCWSPEAVLRNPSFPMLDLHECNSSFKRNRAKWEEFNPSGPSKQRFGSIFKAKEKKRKERDEQKKKRPRNILFSFFLSFSSVRYKRHQHRIHCKMLFCFVSLR